MDTLLEHQDGVVTRAQALRHLPHKAIRQRVANGLWQEPRRSVFVTHNGPLTDAEERWIALLTVRNDAVLGGLTALQAAGLRGHESRTIHLLVPARHQPRRSPPGVAVHRSTLLTETDLVADGKPPRTKVARALVDAAQWARTDAAARAVVSAAFQQRLVIAQLVDEVLSRMTRAHRRALVAETVRAASEGAAHSLAEVDFPRLCRRHGLPEPSRELVRCDRHGRRRFLDALFDEWGVRVEIDGRRHLDPREAWLDMRHQNDVRILGERILRFPTWAVRHRPASVVRQVRAALEAAGWCP